LPDAGGGFVAAISVETPDPDEPKSEPSSKSSIYRHFVQKPSRGGLMIRAHDSIKDSYSICHRVARCSRSNFYPCFFLLDRPKRRAMEALYAFMRHTDDLADGSATLAGRRDELSRWKETLEAALAGGPESLSPDPGASILPALVDTVRKYRIPSEHLLAVLEGVEMDLDGRLFETFDDLAEYCHRVATAVGLACIRIWGFHDHRAFETARHCGLAFQMTNILRDLTEDVAAGRVYLPAEDLRRFDYSADDLAAGVADGRFKELMQFQFERVGRLYRDGVDLFDQIEPDGRPIFGMMTTVYHRLFTRIRSDPAAVLRRRVRLCRVEKLAVAARWILLPPRKPKLA
jgi:phytoene synthase